MALIIVGLVPAAWGKVRVEVMLLVQGVLMLGKGFSIWESLMHRLWNYTCGMEGCGWEEVCWYW